MTQAVRKVWKYQRRYHKM